MKPQESSVIDENRIKAEVFAGGGELGARMRAIEWSETALGPVSHWPQSLKTCIRIILTSAQPMFVWWGDQMINLYNDAYKAIVGGKHPTALGQPASVVWREIWDQVGPRARSAMEKNEGTYDESLLLIMERYGYQEETYYTFSYSPVPNDQGGAGGIICANTDDTRGIISERQLTLLRELAADSANARTREDACHQAARSLEKNDRDICFALIYVWDPAKQAYSVAGTSGVKSGSTVAPAQIAAEDGSHWPLGAAAETPDGLVIEELGSRYGQLPCGSWQRPSSQAALLPIAASGNSGRPGVLVIGLNPHRRYDQDYRGFVKLVAGQISASIANAQAYEEEKKRAEALAEIDRAKTTFFSNVSHELRTPLTLMLGPLEDEISRTDLNEEQRQSWELLHRNALRLLKLVNALLDFSRIEAGRVQVSYVPTDLSRLTAELASMFESAMDRAKLSFKIHTSPLPGSAFVDRDMWEKIVLNLISNALKSTFDGEIEVVLRDAGKGAELVVRDTGTGIPASEIPRLFERFRRIEGARRRTHEGSGIGLALVHELVQLHGGTISVQSTVDEGTEFKVQIPYGTDHLPPDRISTSISGDGAGVSGTAFVQEALSWLNESGENPRLEIDSFEPAPGGRDERETRVLLVDDNSDMREYLRRLLSQRFDVDIAENGGLALQKALADPPDLILSDVMMPVMDGFQLLNALRSDPRTQLIPIIMLSARAGEESRVEGMQAGADDYLVKPFTARELISRVEAHVKMSRLRQEFYEQRTEMMRRLEEAGEAIENITDGFHLFDSEWKVVYLNAAAERMSRRKKEEMLGKSIWEVFPNLVGTPLQEAYLRAVREQTPVEFEWLYQDYDRWFKLRIYPRPGGGAVVYATDTTEVRKAEDALRKAEQLAAVGRLAASISHELNNPLEAVTNLLFLAKTADPDQARGLLELADKEVRRLSHITSRSLKFYRQSTSPTPAQMQEVLDSVLFFYEPRLRTKNIEVERRYEPVPDVFCLTGELQQVFANLVSNAIDATATGGKLVLAISESQDHSDSHGPTVRVTVADNGSGMDDYTKQHLFEPFFTTKGEMGTGLGLWVSREILDKHRVTVRFRSQPGRGTVFSLLFPVEGLRQQQQKIA